MLDELVELSAAPSRRRAVHAEYATPRRAVAHWVLLVAVLGVLTLALGLQTISSSVGEPGTVEPEAAVPVPAPSGGGAVIVRDGDHLAGVALPERTVALTFDDGPDPVWTAKVLEVLAREHVPATFFVVGSRAVEDPALIRKIVAGGHEVGDHTWSHADLATVPSWRANLELSLGQLGLAGSAGVSTSLLRPPYSSSPRALDAAQLRAVERATDAGYLVVLTDRDSEDWRRPGVEQIVANGGPTGTDGEVVLLHDGGGDRAETVAALPGLIEKYRAAGYRFTTVSDGLGLAGGANRPAETLPSLQGRVLGVAVHASSWLVVVMAWSMLIFGALTMIRTVMVVALARRHVRVSARRVAGPESLPPVSVLVPAYNESVGIERSVRSLVASNYPDLEVIVIDDGSTDGTGDVVESLGLAGVRLVRQANAGKAAALRAGTAAASHDVLVMLDGDTVFEPDTIRLLVQALRDPAVGAVSGNTKVGNRAGLLGRWQHLEYVSGFNLDRRLQDLLGCITTVPGAAGAFRRQAVEEAGGLSSETLAEDTDLTMAILRAGYTVVHEERARAWTEAPGSVNDLWRQRYRWSYGTMQSMWKHRRAVLDSTTSGRRLGWIGIPYLVFFQVLMPLVAPAIDLFALYGLLTGNAGPVLAVWLGFAVLQMAVTAYGLHLDGETLRPMWSQPLQQVFYRQLIYLVVIQSIASAVAGVRLPWHKLHRSGEVVVRA
ncbi:bifunctional polysaccharide deacetylase/glycosyltransferase family 2 protein [Cellulomonas edaphi]|uniref:Bifunctional polysaccharide deacetylase/glycosyltransferase family 2 protein n=1 Tax=Cellulomonas edaphi TaxID=3053468 RepID=A0ABT7SBW8_9CELL|nr:bifunctional polysaccharide deacetylase/glycosyltransferase family 2 protein [Cellulomons edaphi]MDM7832492.1 bifunctional polysaccharide deacetylase/glycosyltransferase family 2 protein [Cellulomons edaphi]